MAYKTRVLTRAEKKKRFWIIAGFLSWAICISGIFGNSGIIQAYRVSQLKEEMGFRIQAHQREKQRLEFTLSALNHESFVQEQAIREVLGFVREDELVFEFED